MSKDATIREIHHRVKNNLQTISSLLRLQARRLTNPEAKAAVSESVRRIRTIALVHESLSREPGDDVTFIEIVRPLLRLAEESLQSPDRPVEFSLVGDGGQDPGPRRDAAVGRAHRAAAERRRPRVPRGQRRRRGRRRPRTTTARSCGIDVIDDGHGLDPTFSIESATGLGLSIVRTLVTTELNGHDRDAPGEAGRPRGRRPRGRTAATVKAPSCSSSSRSSSGRSRVVRCERRVAGEERLPACVAGERNEQSTRGGQRRLASGERARWRRMHAALLLGEPAPDARVLIGVEGELETLGADQALSADLPGLLQLQQGEPGRPDREEQLGVRVAAQCLVPPVVVGSSQGESLKQVADTEPPRLALIGCERRSRRR